MAHIKCKYSFPICEYQLRHTRVEHNEYWWCDDDTYCQCGGYTKPINAREINPRCTHCRDVYGEFEKTVKQYEYYDGVLIIGKAVYTDDEILYLEIDGKVLNGGQDNGSD